MDEPRSALDALTRERLYADIQRIWADAGKTIIFVTHNAREAVCLADRVVLLSPRPAEFAINSASTCPARATSIRAGCPNTPRALRRP